jgi:hypothetical protein
MYDPTKRHAIYSTSMNLALPPSPAQEKKRMSTLERRGAMKRSSETATQSASIIANFADDERTDHPGETGHDSAITVLSDITNCKPEYEPPSETPVRHVARSEQALFTPVLGTSHSLPTVSTQKRTTFYPSNLESPTVLRPRSLFVSPSSHCHKPSFEMSVHMATPGSSTSFPSLYSQGSLLSNPQLGQHFLLRLPSLSFPQSAEDSGGSDLEWSDVQTDDDVFGMAETEEAKGPIFSDSDEDLAFHPIVLHLIMDIEQAIAEWSQLAEEHGVEHDHIYEPDT